LDADREGFLRNARSLIQTMGRAARNASGQVLLYADRMTPSMKQAIDETARRRTLQQAYNAQHGIIPKTISRPINNPLAEILSSELAVEQASSSAAAADDAAEVVRQLSPERVAQTVRNLQKEMKKQASQLNFEKAAELRDRIRALEQAMLELG
jgi:excinuclease ABC subunit B